MGYRKPEAKKRRREQQRANRAAESKSDESISHHGRDYTGEGVSKVEEVRATGTTGETTVK